jgi:hypothetical protein
MLTYGTRQAGLRYEPPAATGPGLHGVVAAYGNPEHTRLSVEVKLANGRSCWVNLDNEAVVEGARNDGVGVERLLAVGSSAIPGEEQYAHWSNVSGELVQQCVEKQPRWSVKGMHRLEIRERPVGAPPGIGMLLEVREGRLYEHEKAPTSTWLFFSMPRFDGKMECFLVKFPGRQYRTWWGYVLQGTLPVTVVMDIVTWPVQWLVIRHIKNTAG